MPADRRAERQQALRTLLEAEGLDALLVQSLPNIRALTGFTGSAGLLLVRSSGLVLVTDFRYAAQAPREVGPAAQIETDRVSPWHLLLRLLADAPPECLGYEAPVLSAADLGRLEGARLPLRPTTDLVERLRAAKFPEEVAAIRAAAALAQEALAEFVATVRVGQTEFALAASLEAALRRRGSEWHPFPTIVAGGPRSALPHAGTSARPVGRGELLLVDFGARVDGYCSDLTRTFVVGARADERQRAVYAIVEAAQRRARAGVRAGQTGREADALARDVIAEHGFGDAFGHSLGHGIGLEVHEAPRLSPLAEEPLPAHAVVTVEPGLYFPGWGGVRLEDDLYLHPDGTQLLSDGRTGLVELDVPD